MPGGHDRSIIAEKDPAVLEAAVDKVAGIGTPAALDVLKALATAQADHGAGPVHKISQAIETTKKRIRENK